MDGWMDQPAMPCVVERGLRYILRSPVDWAGRGGESLQLEKVRRHKVVLSCVEAVLVLRRILTAGCSGNNNDVVGGRWVPCVTFVCCARMGMKMRCG